MEKILPSKIVLEAFNLKEEPELLSGGQGTSSLVGEIVIKPGGQEPETSWIADLMNNIQEGGFRVARPLKANNGSWVYEGWSAYNRVEGEPVKGRWIEKVEICKAFHKELVKYPKPQFLEEATHRYAIADKISWQELPMQAHKRLKPALQRLQSLLHPITVQRQLIHGDLSGNILFAQGLPPAVIDFSPYWRCANYAIAIIVADAFVWEGADKTLLEYVSDIPHITQLMIRAEIGRILQLDGLLREEGINKLEEVDAHKPFIEILSQNK